MKAKPEKPKLPKCAPTDHPARSIRNPWNDEAALERTARLFRAIADVSRLRLLARLTEGEWCVSELAHAARLPMSTVSQQLRTLRMENIVRPRRIAKHVYYALADDHVMELVRGALEHANEADGPPEGAP